MEKKSLELTIVLALILFSTQIIGAEEAPLAAQTVSISDLVLAVQTGSTKAFLNKDLTVTGIGMLPLVKADKVDGEIDGKHDDRIAYTPVNIQYPSNIIDKEIHFFIPAELVAKHEALKQDLINRLTFAHVKLVQHKLLWTSEWVLYPLDAFDVIDSQRIATAPHEKTYMEVSWARLWNPAFAGENNGKDFKIGAAWIGIAPSMMNASANIPPYNNGKWVQVGATTPGDAKNPQFGQYNNQNWSFWVPKEKADPLFDLVEGQVIAVYGTARKVSNGPIQLLILEVDKVETK